MEKRGNDALCPTMVALVFYVTALAADITAPEKHELHFKGYVNAPEFSVIARAANGILTARRGGRLFWSWVFFLLILITWEFSSHTVAALLFSANRASSFWRTPPSSDHGLSPQPSSQAPP